MNSLRRLAFGITVIIIAMLILLVAGSQKPAQQSAANSIANSTIAIPTDECGNISQTAIMKFPKSFQNISDAMTWCENCLKTSSIPAFGDSGPFCDILTSDSGRSCTDMKDCEGVCVADNSTATTGKCSSTKVLVGCYDVLYSSAPIRRCFHS